MTVAESDQIARMEIQRVERRFSWSRLTVGAIVAFWIAVVIVPVALLVPWSFMRVEQFRFAWSFNLDAYAQMIDTGRLSVVVNTLRIALTVTAIALVVSLPVALWLAKGVRSNAFRVTMMAVLTIPFFVSLASRTIVMRPVLGRTGPINSLLMQWGIIDAPIDGLLFSEFAVHLGLLAPAFPTMLFPIFAAIALVDDDLIEASRDLGASPFRVFMDVILPLAMPGIVAGIVFTLVPMLGDTVVPQLLGGTNVAMLGTSMTSIVGNMNYAGGAALAVAVLVLLAILVLAMRVAQRRSGLDRGIFEGLRR
jgi:spermidine/putrescine transport system permease protein